MNPISAFLSNLVARFGYTLLASWRIERFAQAQYLARLFRCSSVDCVFDVGANTGQFRDFLRNEVGYTGLIISYEPIPELAADMQARSKYDAAWIVESCALGREAGVGLFNITRGTDFSSFLMPDDSLGAAFNNRNRISRQVEVEIRVLSKEFDRQAQIHSFVAPYLKCDTQGFDMEVVSGAAERLERFIGMQVEASVKPIYSGMPSYSDVVSQLRVLGMVPSAFFPVNDSLFPELIEFDCHLVNVRWIDQIRRSLQCP